ncbi:hypothetical protein HPB50_004021 [Hyalomma asiaticum]|uniref:Uncharacterized protein n=1 Tax=Hyalomma asiaticum TaxID=266040 RepID=A0ACB7ST22_HYAAI|nr:hypothetical protein HPB50_004021 [Hyalomma asiaticum]
MGSATLRQPAEAAPGPLELLSTARVYRSQGAIADFFPEQTRAARNHPGASSCFSSSAGSTCAIAIFARPTKTSTTVEYAGRDSQYSRHTQSDCRTDSSHPTPHTQATHKLMALGITNTVSEMIEATLTARYERLSLTHAGRAILQQVGISPTRMASNYADLTPEYRRSLYIPPVPKRMHPEHHADRRADRARQFEKRFSGRPDVTYTDATYHPSKPAMVAAALAPHRSWYTACSIRKTEMITAAEEVAIALALADPLTKVVVSDSQQAIRNYDAGRISCKALRVLLSSPPPSTSRVLLWAPAHESLSGNAQLVFKAAWDVIVLQVGAQLFRSMWHSIELTSSNLAAQR